jgi:hypothetical protein
MAITDCRLYQQPEAEQDDHRQWSYQAVWQIITDDRSDDAMVVHSTMHTASPTPVPRMWSRYNVGGSLDFFSFVRKIRLKLADAGKTQKKWHVHVEWRPMEPDEEEEDKFQHPLARPTKYHLEAETFTELLEEDSAGNPIVNAAGQEFDSALEQESSRVVLVARKNYGSLQQIIDKNVNFAHHMNSDNYRGEAAKRWLCRPILTSEIQVERGIRYWTATFRLVLREGTKTWDRKVVNQGFYHKRGVNDDELVRAVELDKNGKRIESRPLAAPVLLKADGTREAKGVTGNLITFTTRPSAAFRSLGV